MCVRSNGRQSKLGKRPHESFSFFSTFNLCELIFKFIGKNRNFVWINVSCGAKIGSVRTQFVNHQYYYFEEIALIYWILCYCCCCSTVTKEFHFFVSCAYIHEEVIDDQRELRTENFENGYVEMRRNNLL